MSSEASVTYFKLVAKKVIARNLKNVDTLSSLGGHTIVAKQLYSKKLCSSNPSFQFAIKNFYLAKFGVCPLHCCFIEQHAICRGLRAKAPPAPGFKRVYSRKSLSRSWLDLNNLPSTNVASTECNLYLKFCLLAFKSKVQKQTNPDMLFADT